MGVFLIYTKLIKKKDLNTLTYTQVYRQRNMYRLALTVIRSFKHLPTTDRKTVSVDRWKDCFSKKKKRKRGNVIFELFSRNRSTSKISAIAKTSKYFEDRLSGEKRHWESQGEKEKRVRKEEKVCRKARLGGSKCCVDGEQAGFGSACKSN